jgi:hypothetical protein
MSHPRTHYPDSEPTVFALSLYREATNTNFTVFGFDQGLYPQSTTLEASMQTIAQSMWFPLIGLIVVRVVIDCWK